ncbi:fibronectin type III domain-containing protein [Dactylosporangium darangshiense]|uniref:Fibronectin type-III domain-containing protein n=1 Tax=Dactylosporangium darangshiense TaxID=579108 RepID=A0ABP8CYK2_9ACTN
MSRSRWRLTRADQVLALVLGTALVSFAPATARAELPGADAQLARAPYLTDLTGTSVQVTWATTARSQGVVKFGQAGNCTASSVMSGALGSPITVNGATRYQSSIRVSGLQAGATYCYRVYSDAGTDLLGDNPSPSFTTLEPADSTKPFTFAVFGDWGDTTNGGVNDGTLNANQAGVLAQVGASGARFALQTGDLGYPSGSQTNFGDLQQAGVNVSAVFGPAYWAGPGQKVPLYTLSANHGRNANLLSTWPQSAVTAASGGVYDMVSYPSIAGTDPASYPTSYYAFSTGGVRFYLLDASWSDQNVGTATGGECGSHCAMYDIDHQAHWTPASAEYQWLQRDLAAHPSELKMAAFHFPLRSDDNSQPGSQYLQHTPGATGSLEKLLADGGVKLVFNGHSHSYQRQAGPPGGVFSYVTGGGGARLSSVSSCSPNDGYALGWSYSKQKGYACGAAPVPTSDAQVFHFVKVRVDGKRITVTPTDAQGRTFDVQTFDFGADSTAPSAPPGLTATKSGSTKVRLQWSAATDNVGVAAYDVYRDSQYLATVQSGGREYIDATAVVGTGYTYHVQARDLAGNTGSASVPYGNGTPTDTVPPAAPAGLTVTGTGTTTVSLSWSPSSDNVGVAGYDVLRNGAPVATVAGTGFGDVGLTPGTEYTYRVVARDAAGNASSPSAPVTVTTVADTSPPTAPGSLRSAGTTASQVTLQWSASTDNVGVVRYDIRRNGAIIGTASGTRYTDTTVAPGTSYTYTVTAFDTAGNQATSAPVSVTTQLQGSVFYDGFETGDLGQWSPVSGLTVQGSIAHTGTNAARASGAGAVSYAYTTLSNTYQELWMQGWVFVASRETSVNLLGFRTSTGSSIVNVYIDASGRLSLRNNVGGTTTYGSTVVSPGAWHQVVLHAAVNGAASTVDVTLDGVAVPGLTLTGQNLGTAQICRLQIGESTAGRTYDVVLDDITVSSTPLTGT